MCHEPTQLPKCEEKSGAHWFQRERCTRLGWHAPRSSRDGEGMGRESVQSPWAPHAVSGRTPYPLHAPSQGSSSAQAFLETLRESVERYEETFRGIPRATA